MIQSLRKKRRSKKFFWQKEKKAGKLRKRALTVSKKGLISGGTHAGKSMETAFFE